jgi:hypothetical protein
MQEKRAVERLTEALRSPLPRHHRCANSITGKWNLLYSRLVAVMRNLHNHSKELVSGGFITALQQPLATRAITRPAAVRKRR